MLALLTLKNIKLIGFSLVLLLLTTYAITQRFIALKHQRESSAYQQQLASCAASNELLQSAVARWQEEAQAAVKLQEDKDRAIAKRTKQAEDSVQAIMQRKYSNDCNKAIKEGLSDIVNKPKFEWSGNLP